MTTCGVLNILGWDSKHNGGLVPFRILKMNLVVTPAFAGGAKAKHGLQAMEGKAIVITSAVLLPQQDASGVSKREGCSRVDGRYSTQPLSHLRSQEMIEKRGLCEGIPQQEMIPILPLFRVLARKRRDVEYAKDGAWPAVLVDLMDNHNFPVSLFMGAIQARVRLACDMIVVVEGVLEGETSQVVDVVAGFRVRESVRGRCSLHTRCSSREPSCQVMVRSWKYL